LAFAVSRLCPEIGAPVKTDNIRVKILSGPKGSAPGDMSFRM